MVQVTDRKNFTGENKMRLTPKQAYRLLTAGLDEPESIGYVTHCRYVGDLAGLIAGEMGLDPEYASTLGYLHDVGRKVDPGNHIYAGYKYLKENGYDEYAFICLTHSFLNNDIECICGRLLPPESEGYAEVKAFVESHKNVVFGLGAGLGAGLWGTRNGAARR